jgi:molecular chaperone GrpE
MDDERQTAPEADPEGAADTVEVADSAALLATVTGERDRLAQERADLYDQLLRRTAEFDNFRRRSQKERTETFDYAGMETVRELLPVLDDFERALKIECSDKGFLEGIDLIYQRLSNALKKIGLEPMDTVGQIFDPHWHQAVEMVTDSEAGDNTIVQELQRGYNFKGRLLRPAMVKVAVKP